MNRFFRLTTTLALVACFGLTACDSSDEADSASFEADMAAMNANVSTALSTAFQTGFSPGKRAQPRGNCSERGTVDVTSAGSSSTGFNFDITFNDCNGIDGTLDMDGNIAGAGYTSTINGELRERCTISYNNFQQSTNASGSVTLNGSYGATCEGVSRTCSFSNDSIDASTGADFYTSRCN